MVDVWYSYIWYFGAAAAWSCIHIHSKLLCTLHSMYIIRVPVPILYYSYIGILILVTPPPLSP
jgi:hypothetical protein